MKNKSKTKLISLLIAFLISVFFASIISFCLVKIFSRQPQEILNITLNEVINTILTEKEGLEIFILSIFAFLLFIFVSNFKMLDLDDYLSKTYTVIPNIKIPLPVGKNQTQQGSAWWLSKKELYKKPFGVNTFDPNNPVIHNLLDFSRNQKEIEKIKMDRLKKINSLMENKKISFSEAEKQVEVQLYQENNLADIQTEQLKIPLFKEGGICVGKKDRNVLFIEKVKLLKRIPFIKFNKRKVEDIFFIKEDMHSLTVGATRSGKTRCLVLESIGNTALAGENMIISDPKR